MINNQIICLGANCAARYFVTKAGIKPSKGQGELSMPFDLAVHFPERIPYIIKTRFKGYLRGIYFDNTENMFKIHVKKQWWKKKKTELARLNHETDLGNDIKKVKQRYKHRIRNFLSAIKSHDELYFVQTLEYPYNPSSLIRLLRELYSHKKFRLLILDFSGKMPTINEPDVTIVSCPYPYKNYIWYDATERTSAKGKAFENKVIREIKTFFK